MTKELHLVRWRGNVSRPLKGNWALASEFAATTSKVEVIHIDVSSDESFNAAYEMAKARPGYLDVLVKNASAKKVFRARGAGNPAIGGALIRSVIEGERDGDARMPLVVAGQDVQSF
ncbi:hypothetical protein MY3296_002824 [Beauveria thailandica]